MSPAAGGALACELLQACTAPAPQPATSASDGQALPELLRLVQIVAPAFELLALLAGPLRWSRWT